MGNNLAQIIYYIFWKYVLYATMADVELLKYVSPTKLKGISHK
jgi:hypothetical protein